MDMGKVLVACEESQAVTKELRAMGIEAYSCDILPCSGGHPEWHLQQDVTELLKQKWDMIIAFPPCTDLAVSGARYFEDKRKDGRQAKSIRFFMQFINADCDLIAVENPIGIISGSYIGKHFKALQHEFNFPIKYSQIIQPYEHGHECTKSTCLWLKGLPLIQPTNIVGKGEYKEYVCPKTGKKKRQSKWIYDAYAHGKDRQKNRSKTFEGIAKAMASQWGGLLLR